MVKTFREDNVVPFERTVDLATSPSDPSGPDWLRELPHGARFLCQRKDVATGFVYEMFGIAGWTPKAVLLWSFSEMRSPMWVDSKRFSRMYNWIETLPDKEAGSENDSDLPPRPADSSSDD